MRSASLVAATAAVMIGLVTLASPAAHATTKCYNGAAKGLVYESGEWHHYVEFRVDVSMPDDKWYVGAKPAGFPFGASVWQGYYSAQRRGGPAVYKEVGYNWLGNLPDPYPASGWVLCHV